MCIARALLHAAASIQRRRLGFAQVECANSPRRHFVRLGSCWKRVASHHREIAWARARRSKRKSGGGPKRWRRRRRNAAERSRRLGLPSIGSPHQTQRTTASPGAPAHRAASRARACEKWPRSHPTRTALAMRAPASMTVVSPSCSTSETRNDLARELTNRSRLASSCATKNSSSTTHGGASCGSGRKPLESACAFPSTFPSTFEVIDFRCDALMSSSSKCDVAGARPDQSACRTGRANRSAYHSKGRGNRRRCSRRCQTPSRTRPSTQSLTAAGFPLP